MNNNNCELYFLIAIILILGVSGAIIYKQGKKLQNFSDQISYQEKVGNWFQNDIYFSDLLLGASLNEDGIQTGSFDHNDIALIISDYTCQSCMEAEIERLIKAKLNSEIHVYCIFESKRKFKTFLSAELRGFANVDLIHIKETSWNYLKDPIYCKMDGHNVISTYCVDPKLNTLTDTWLEEAIKWSRFP